MTQRASPSRPARSGGFTLVELMVTLAVAAILVMIGVPSLSRFIMNNSVSSQTNEVVASLRQARSEAGRRGVPVAMASASGAGTAFGQGWSVFTDANGDGAKADTDTVLRTNEASPSGISVTRVTQSGSTYSTATGDKVGFVVFNSRGAVAATTLLRVCSSSMSSIPGRVVQVTPVGRVSVVTGVACP